MISQGTGEPWIATAQDSALAGCGWEPGQLYDFRASYNSSRLRIWLRCYGTRTTCAAGCLSNVERLIFDVTPSHPAASQFAQFESGRFGESRRW